MHATREHILSATPAVFAAHGFVGASTRMLASAAEVNVATIAYHFGDKQGLYEAVIDHVYGRLLAHEIPALGPGDRRARLGRLVAAVFAAAKNERDGIRVLLRHVMAEGRLPESVRERWTPLLMERTGAAIAALAIEPESIDPLALLSLNHLIARYAVSDARDIAPFTGGKSPESAVVAHLSDLAWAVLNPS
jgi:AcrR family transcriptional regulator